jgi:hypothetical protein
MVFQFWKQEKPIFARFFNTTTFYKIDYSQVIQRPSYFVFLALFWPFFALFSAILYNDLLLFVF